MSGNGLRRKGFDEVHELVLNAALEVFALRGYSKATTSEIARVAGTSEPLLFRHFGSKAGLYEAAVIRPFAAFLDSFTKAWVDRRDPHPVELPVYEFTSWTYRELRRHRSLALALFGALLHDDGPEIDSSTLRKLLDQCTAVIDYEARLRGWDHIDVPIATRLMLGMIVSAALFKEWSYEVPEQVDDQQVIDQVVTLVLRGVDSEGESRPSPARVADEEARGRAVITAPDQPSALAAASQWAARRGVDIESMTWAGTQLRLYYAQPDRSAPLSVDDHATKAAPEGT
jgi:AcrR family transcriptional regulator